MKNSGLIISIVMILGMLALLYYYPLISISGLIASFGLLMLVMKNAKEIKNQNDKIHGSN